TTAAAPMPIMIPVTLSVVTSPAINVSPSAITISAIANSAATTVPIQLTSTDGTTKLGFTAASSTSPSGQTWLSVSPASGSTAAALTVTITPGTLAPGTYNGTVTVTPATTGATAISIPVVLVIGSSSITVSPSSVSFSQVFGSAAPNSQTIQVSGI